MPIQNMISASLPEPVKSEVLQAIGEIRTKLDFLIALVPDETKSLFKAGNDYIPFIDQAYNAVVSFPEILPPALNVEEFKKDYQLAKDLAIIVTQIKALAESLQKTQTVVNSDALAFALEVYGLIKLHCDKIPGLQAVANEMAVFFKRPIRKSTPPVS